MAEKTTSTLELNKVATGLPPKLDASSDEKAFYGVARFAAQNDHFVGHYKTWTKAINFLVGEHWRTKWDGTSQTWNYEKDIPAWHQQPVTNITFAVYRSAIAKLTKQKPTLEVVPPSGDSDDKEAALVCEAVLVFLWRYLKKPRKVPVLVAWLLVTGQAWVRVGWDPMGGEYRPRTIPLQRKRKPLGAGEEEEESGYEPAEPEDDDAEDVEVAADENGDAYKTSAGAIDYDREPDMEPIGEVCFEIISPLCVRMNPDATSPDDATEMYVGTLRPKNQVADHFGVKEEDIADFGNSTEQRELYEDLLSATAAAFPRSWSDQQSVWGVSQQDAIGDRILVIEVYSYKCKDFPKGRHWISAGLKKVWPPENAKQAAKAESYGEGGDATPDDYVHGEAPLPFGFWPPLVPCLDTPIPGQPTALGVITQVVPLNEQLDIMDGKIAEKHTMDSMGGVWFVAPEDKGIVITSEPGQVIVSKAMGRRGAAYAPFQAQMKPLPEAVYREREVLMNKVMVVSGMTNVDLSQQPQGTPSGRALLVNQETSDSVLMPTLVSIENCLEECGRRELVICQAMYTAERTIAIKGEEGEWLYHSFTNADLGDGHDVRVQVGSSFPWSKSAQWDTKLSLVQALPQLFLKPDGTVDKEHLAKALDSGTPGLGTFESEENPDLVEIQREHAMFENYDPDAGRLELPQLGFWQTHHIHYEQHADFLKRDFGRFKRWHPAARQAFMQHLQLTLMAVEQQAESMLGPAASPGAAAPGEAPPPDGAPATPGEPAPPGSPAGLSLVPTNAPDKAQAAGSPARLNRADFASAGSG